MAADDEPAADSAVDDDGAADWLVVVAALAPELMGGCCSVDPQAATSNTAVSVTDSSTFCFRVRRFEKGRVTVMRKQSSTGRMGRSR